VPTILASHNLEHAADSVQRVGGFQMSAMSARNADWAGNFFKRDLWLVVLNHGNCMLISRVEFSIANDAAELMARKISSLGMLPNLVRDFQPRHALAGGHPVFRNPPWESLGSRLRGNE
jgi:hypothetical protein